MTPSGRDLPVVRPTKKTEYEIRFINRAAQKGWIDLVAVATNAATDAALEAPAASRTRNSGANPQRKASWNRGIRMPP